jgi:putative membrane protein
MMVRDHSKANDDLKQAVAPFNVPVPAELGQTHRDLVTKLQGLRGAEFDREYISAMVDGHEEMQNLLEDRADAGRDATAHDGVNTSLNQWAEKTRPSVDRHLKMAQQIRDKLENTRNTTR